MKTHFRTKKINFSVQVVIVIFLVVLLVGYFFVWFSSKATPKLIHVAELTISEYIDRVASDFKLQSLPKNASDEFLIISENSEGEITSVDYDMQHIYELAGDFTEFIQSSLKEPISVLSYQRFDSKTEDVDGIVLAMPLGVVSDSIFLTNLGPKIPVTIHFIDSVLSQVKTSATDYGINNVLLEVYLNVKISYEIISPVMEEEKTIEYQLLLDSKVIQGSVPNWYSSPYESKTTFFEVYFP